MTSQRSLFAAIEAGEERTALEMPDGSHTYRELRGAVARASDVLKGEHRLGLWATPERATIVALCGALAAGVTVVPLNPKAGERELAHVIDDAALTQVLANPRATLPQPLRSLRRIGVEHDGAVASDAWPPMSNEGPALIMYTSGTTGPPKGVVLSRRAIDHNLDALATIWEWTERDHLVHALPLFHVHGLILGVLGPLFVGGSVRHLGSFSLEGVVGGLSEGGSMLFGVPTMYHRIAQALEIDSPLARSLAQARLLVSGSGPLLTSDFERIEKICAQRVIERYGMTETLMITSVDPRSPLRPGYVGRPLASVEVRVVDEQNLDVDRDDETIGAVLVRSPSMFDEYLNMADATKATLVGGWFATGDLGVLTSDGNLRLVGRASSDLVKSGGYRIGTSEIEQVLLEHPFVEEVAVRGVPDADLGERIVAWVVLGDNTGVEGGELIDFVARMLAAHKRPREIVVVDELPRNAMGKIQKHLLTKPIDR